MHCENNLWLYLCIFKSLENFISIFYTYVLNKNNTLVESIALNGILIMVNMSIYLWLFIANYALRVCGVEFKNYQEKTVYTYGVVKRERETVTSYDAFYQQIYDFKDLLLKIFFNYAKHIDSGLFGV